jgi:sulfonate transport system permease protein
MSKATETAVTAKPGWQMPSLEDLKARFTVLIIPILLITGWQVSSLLGIFHPSVLPSPLKVWQALERITADGTLQTDLAISATRVLRGYFWGMTTALVIGVLSGLSKFIERLVGTVVDAVRQIPTFAWIPLIVLWFGIGELSKNVIIGKAVFIPIFINTLQGIRGVSADHVEVARVLELSHFKFLFKVVIPSALPSIFTGLRLAAGHSWMAVVGAEMIGGGLSGLGYALTKAKDFLLSDELIGLMFVIGLVGLAVDRILKRVETVALRWRKSFSGSGK